MGDMADLTRETEERDDFLKSEDYSRYADFTLWLGKDREFYEFRDMEDSHIENCIKMLNRQIVHAEMWVSVLKKEQKRRPN